jgi:hypothetical protein
LPTATRPVTTCLTAVGTGLPESGPGISENAAGDTDFLNPQPAE